MNRYVIITIIIILIGFIIFTIGIVLGDLFWNVIGGIMIILPPIILNIKIKKEKKSLIHYIESEKRPILSSKKTREEFEIKEYWKKARKFLEKLIIMIFVAAVALGLAIMIMSRYIFKPTYISSEAAVSDGCIIFNMGGCKEDPSEIIVNYDVNGDEIVGGVNDTLSNLLEMYNCTGNCIKRRCGCPGY